MPKTITLSQGLEVIVDDADYLSLVVFKWYALADGSKERVYAARHAPGDNRRLIFMHRALLGEPDGIVRHINGNGLDNRRENLCVVPRKQEVRADG